MFGRPRTAPDRDLSLVGDALHERLAGSTAMTRVAPSRRDPRDLRRRLGGSPSPGLRDRLDGRLSPT